MGSGQRCKNAILKKKVFVIRKEMSAANTANTTATTTPTTTPELVPGAAHLHVEQAIQRHLWCCHGVLRNSANTISGLLTKGSGTDAVRNDVTTVNKGLVLDNGGATGRMVNSADIIDGKVITTVVSVSRNPLISTYLHNEGYNPLHT